MFLCLFAFLLLNSSYRSLGVPVPTKAPELLSKLLTALGNSCENVFLTDQIKSKLNYCAELSSPHGEKQLECLIFYDVNLQLCDAVGASKLALADDYSAKINEEQDLNLLCGNTKEWVFSNLTGFADYKNSVEKIFKHPVTCGKVCGPEDLMSDDTNFYCKYFKWGMEMLKQRVNMPSTQENSVQLPPETGINVNEPVISVPNDLLDVQIKDSTTSNAHNIPSVPSAVVKKEEIGKIEAVKPKASSENNHVSEPLNANSASENSDPKTIHENQVVQNPPITSEQADKLPRITDPELKSEDDNKPEVSDIASTKQGADSPQKSEVDNEIQLLNSELEHKEPVLETPGQAKGKQPLSDVDDYQDSDEGKEGLVDIQGGDDGDDPLIDEETKISKLDEQKTEQKEEQRESQSLKTIVSGISGESVSGLYPSFGQDSYSDDDDDHFFSFFLTGVIMVAVIYVLYHNKNKFGKVFFGLILEGRQTGRRRNSRGHAYRRLDTLEQAMSTNAAAPPSKIIY